MSGVRRNIAPQLGRTNAAVVRVLPQRAVRQQRRARSRSGQWAVNSGRGPTAMQALPALCLLTAQLRYPCPLIRLMAFPSRCGGARDRDPRQARSILPAGFLRSPDAPTTRPDRSFLRRANSGVREPSCRIRYDPPSRGIWAKRSLAEPSRTSVCRPSPEPARSIRDRRTPPLPRLGQQARHRRRRRDVRQRAGSGPRNRNARPHVRRSRRKSAS